MAVEEEEAERNDNNGEEKETPIPVAITPPEHTKLLDRLNTMDERVEFVAGELALKQGEKVGFAIGILYGLLIGIFVYIIFLI